MTAFLDDNLFLTTPTARHLFEAARVQPIVDVHNHLVPAEIAANRRWDNLTELWLGDDHYKWRAMRLAGIPESLITGDADPWERFQAWASTVPRLIGNPLYTWTHLELRRVFGIAEPLGPSNAEAIYRSANEQLADLTAQSLLGHFGVEFVATTDSPIDDLVHHAAHVANGGSPAMAPTFRPDAAHALLDDPEAWNEWIDALAERESIDIDDLDSLLDALRAAHDRFGQAGCRASDHGLACLPDRARDADGANSAIRFARTGAQVSADAAELVLLEVVALIAELDAADARVLQLHLGPLRNVSPTLLDSVGRDAGADVMGDRPQAGGLARFLGALDAAEILPRTVLYNLNPADNEVMVTMAGAFARSGTAQHVQWGPPWWFNDHDAGMRRQLDVLAQIGQLAGFVGMLTDSRSILSMTRHELFRRILCQKLGDEVESGRYPKDLAALESMVRGVCVDNARTFFGLEPKA